MEIFYQSKRKDGNMKYKVCGWLRIGRVKTEFIMYVHTYSYIELN